MIEVRRAAGAAREAVRGRRLPTIEITESVKKKFQCTPYLQWFRGGLVFEAHRLLYHSAYGSRTF